MVRVLLRALNIPPVKSSERVFTRGALPTQIRSHELKTVGCDQCTKRASPCWHAHHTRQHLRWTRFQRESVQGSSMTR